MSKRVPRFEMERIIYHFYPTIFFSNDSIKSSRQATSNVPHSNSDESSSDEIARITNGDSAEISDYPHMVSLQKRGNHFCGASIISPRHCLTAAHCGRHRSDMSIYSILASATANSGRGARKGITFPVWRIIRHQNYTENPINNDIAIWIVGKQMPINGKTIRVAVLPAADDPLPFGESGFVAGWYVCNLYSNETNHNLKSI